MAIGMQDQEVLVPGDEVGRVSADGELEELVVFRVPAVRDGLVDFDKIGVVDDHG